MWNNPFGEFHYENAAVTAAVAVATHSRCVKPCQQAEASSPRFSTSPSHTIIAVFQPQQRWQWQLFIRPTTPPHREIFIISKQTPEKNNKNNENR